MKKTVKLDDMTGWMVVGFLLCCPLVLAAIYGWLYLLTCGTQWVALELFQKDLPYWPVFVAILIINAIFGGKTRQITVKSK